MHEPRPAPMRVVHVVRQFAPSVGGLEEAVLKLCLALRHRGIAASVVTLDRIAKGPPEPLRAIDTVEGIAVRRIPFSGSWRYPVAPGVLAHLGAADVVHVHAIDFFFDFLSVTRLWHRKPMVASTHGGFFHTAFAQRLKRVYFHTVTRAAALGYRRICASSESDLALFRAIAPRNLTLIENGVDIEKWADLASPEPVRTLIAVGRFASNKQLDKLFPLLAALRNLHPAWRLVIAGRPWDVTAAELLRSAANHGLAAAVDLLESPGDGAIAGAIRSASYVVSASRHEGFGIGVVEGLSAGLVPVLNDIPPFATLVREANCGCLVDIDRIAAAARRIEDLHHATAAEPAAARLACRAAAARNSWSASADRFIAQYRDALAHR